VIKRECQDKCNFSLKRFFLQYFILISINFAASNSCFGANSQYLLDSVPSCIIENGRYFLETPYKANILDGNEIERLVCTNQHFDCVTFVEYVLALSLYQNQGNDKTDSFENILQKLRYRDGTIADYGSRLHYFSEWVLQNEKRSIFRNISAELGGIKFLGKINFMSSHKSKYPKLDSKKDLDIILSAEAILNKSGFYYIPKNDVAGIKHLLNDGDIIGIATNINGLDFVHTGFAIKQKNDVYLLHASEKFGKVVISDESLDQ
jgi:hypothetical protein